MLSIVVSIHDGLPRGTLPLCLNVKLKCLCSAHRETLPTCEWLQKRRNEHIPFLMLAKSGDILQDLWPFYFTSSPPPPLCSIKETGIQAPIRWYSRMIVHHLLGCLAFRIKSLVLASTPRLLIIGLSYSEQTELGFSNNKGK